MLLFLLFFLPAWAVYVGWPMNEQLPNVGRVGESYTFTLASITYRSDLGGSISYTVSDMPDWLSFDSDSRTFSGNPSANDVGTFRVNLTGTDSADGSSLSLQYDMLVSDNSGLRLSAPDVMFTSIAKYGDTNGVNGLVVHEGEKFAITFGPDVFVQNAGSERPILSYYGRSSDRTSLPNWVSFDSNTYTFSGTVPYVVSSIAPSMLYGFSFIGSDYAGFAGAEGIFYLVVGAHLLSTLLNESIKVNGTYGSDFDYTVPVLSSVYLDGALITATNISSVTVNNLPSYVTFDQQDYTLSGIFPNASTFDNFTVVVSDVYGNLVELPYSFDSIGLVFTTESLPDVNATRGEYFLFQLMHSYFTDFNNTDVAVSFNTSWLSYHELNMTLAGQAPKDLDIVEVTVKASSNFGSESRNFDVVGVNKHVEPSASLLVASSLLMLLLSSQQATATLASSTTSSVAATTSAATQNKSSDNHHKLVLGLAIALPLFAVLVAGLLVLFCCCRRRTDDADVEKTATESDHTEPELTGPGIGVTYDIDDHNEEAHQLSTLNALKLDNDNMSTLSTLTHVESDESRYYDAKEKPLRSWRANEMSDASAIKKEFLLQRPTSQLSQDTVNTEKLFSMRLVDDGSVRNSFQSNSMLPQSLIRDSSSQNLHRVDSNGNDIDGGDYINEQRVVNLNDIEEEGNTTNTTFYKSADESSNFNLLSKFFNDRSPSNLEFDAETYQSFGEDSPPMPGDGWDNKFSPDSETFLLNEEATPKNNLQVYNKNQSRTSVYSNISSKGDGNAKLVDFTRKSSLRESARHQSVKHLEESAQIHNGDSE